MESLSCLTEKYPGMEIESLDMVESNHDSVITITSGSYLLTLTRRSSSLLNSDRELKRRIDGAGSGGDFGLRNFTVGVGTVLSDDAIG